MKFYLGRVENIVGKGEKAGYRYTCRSDITGTTLKVELNTNQFTDRSIDRQINQSINQSAKESIPII